MCLESCYLFENISKAQFKTLESIMDKVSTSKGQNIFREGEDALFLYILKKGKVELTMRIENSLELPIAILRESGNSFGISALIRPHQYSLSAHSIEESTLVKIDRIKIQQVISEDRDLGCIIMSNAATYFYEHLAVTRRELKIHFKTLIKYMLV